MTGPRAVPARSQDGGYGTAKDSGGATVPPQPHISMWLALDDMSEQNGGLRVLPFERNPAPQQGDGDHSVKWMAAPRAGGVEQPMYQHRFVEPEDAGAVNLDGDISGTTCTNVLLILSFVRMLSPASLVRMLSPASLKV